MSSVNLEYITQILEILLFFGSCMLLFIFDVVLIPFCKKKPKKTRTKTLLLSLYGGLFISMMAFAYFTLRVLMLLLLK